MQSPVPPSSISSNLCSKTPDVTITKLPSASSLSSASKTALTNTISITKRNTISMISKSPKNKHNGSISASSTNSSRSSKSPTGSKPVNNSENSPLKEPCASIVSDASNLRKIEHMTKSLPPVSMGAHVSMGGVGNL